MMRGPRFLFYGISLIYFIIFPPVVSGWSQVPSILWHPTFFFALFHLSALPDIWMQGLLGLWWVSLFCAAVGWRSRLFSFLAFLGGFYLLGLPNCYGHSSHEQSPYVLVLATLAFLHEEPPGWVYFAVRTQLLMIYAIAGLQKLCNGGLNVFPKNLAADFIYTGKPLGLFVAQSPALCFALGAVILFFEVSSLVAFFIPRIQKYYFGFFFMMHALTNFLLPPTFVTTLICYVFVIPRRELKRISVTTVVLLMAFLGMYIYGITNHKDCWPFGRYKMYATESLAEKILWNISLVTDDGKRRPQHYFDSRKVDELIPMRYSLPGWEKQGPEVLKKNVDLLLVYLNRDGHRYKGINVYSLSPDEKASDESPAVKANRRQSTLYYSTLSEQK